MSSAGAGGILTVILLSLISSCYAAYGEYSGSHMPQYADYEEPRESPVEDYSQPPEPPAELDSKYDDETRDKHVHTYKNRDEINDDHQTASNVQEDDKKAWSSDYIETYNDNPTAIATKLNPKARFFKKRQRLIDEKQKQDEFRHSKNDEIRAVDEIDSFDDDIQNERLKNNNLKNQNQPYKHQTELDEMKLRHKFIHRKSTNKIIRRKPRDRQRSRYDISDKENEKPLFDLADMAKLKAGNLLDDGSLVPKPIKLNPQYDYYDINRIKETKNLPHRRIGVSEKVRAENSEVHRSTMPNYRRRGPDLDKSKVSEFPFLRGGSDLENKINEVDNIRKYLNEGLQDRGEIRTDSKKSDEPIIDEVFDISEHIPSDIEDIKKHLTGSLNKSNRKDIDIDKSQDFTYDISEEELPKPFPVGTPPAQSSENMINNVLMKTRPPYRRMEETDSSRILLSEVRTTQKSTNKKPVTKVSVTPTKETTTMAKVTTADTVNSSVAELSLAEKSRLSILKKVMRKESVNRKTTVKPPVLMQVMNGMNTMVMVEPPSTLDPWKRAREVSGDTKERLKQVKRLMRRKLVSNAKNIRELTENWDDMICDYVDMSLVKDNSFLFKENWLIVIVCCFVTVLY